MAGVQPYLSSPPPPQSTFLSLAHTKQSQACVPAPHGLLSPFSDAHVCPASSERFELRTRTLSCAVSTVTALTAVVSVLGTLLVVGVVFGVLHWWRGRTSTGQGTDPPDENTSLLRAGRRRSYWVYNTVPADGEERPRLERYDTGTEDAEAVGGSEFEERRRRMLERRANEV